MSETARRPLRASAPDVFRSGALSRLVMAGAAVAILAGCQVSDLSSAKHLAPVPSGLERKITRMNMRVSSPIFVRIFKEENELEVWKQTRSGRYELLKTYDICAWSGKLGPKFKEGDRQAPEGFYTVTRGQMNPNSSYHLAFNIGFPNQYDRSHGRTGSHLMVHGDCSSRGCYAMEDAQIEEIYALAREAFRGGQSAFHVHAFPFRMTPENMARHADSEHLEFWEMLKTGSDHFEVTKQVPRVDVCGKQYVFNASGGRFVPSQPCPDYQVNPNVARLVAAKQEADLAKRETVIANVDRTEERRKRWDEREAAVAAFFDAGRKPEASGDPQTATVAVVPDDNLPDGDPPVRIDDAPKGLRFGLFDRNANDDEPQGAVASISGVTDAPTTPAPAPAPAAQTAAAPVPQAAPADGASTAAAAPAEAEQKGGFFDKVKQGGGGLLRRAGSLFN